MSTTRSNVTVHCDACRRILHTQRTTTKGARGDARRAGWIVAAIYSGDASEDHAAKDMCPQCLRRRQAGAELCKRMPRRGVQAINRYRLHWTVQRVTADAVARLYDQLVDLDAAEHMTPIGYARSVASAKRRGWEPPAAWDADSIDDPAARPMPTDPESVRLREQVRAYRMRRAA